MPVFPALLAPVAALLPVSLGTWRASLSFFVVALHAYVALSFAWASSFNYPGSAALEVAHQAAATELGCPSTVGIFIDDYAAMSGINRFQQLGTVQLGECDSFTTFIYEKNPVFFDSSRPDALYGNQTNMFDFILVRATDEAWHADHGQYRLIRRVSQLANVAWRQVPPRLQFSDFLLVMARNVKTGFSLQ